MEADSVRSCLECNARAEFWPQNWRIEGGGLRASGEIHRGSKSLGLIMRAESVLKTDSGRRENPNYPLGAATVLNWFWETILMPRLIMAHVQDMVLV